MKDQSLKIETAIQILKPVDEVFEAIVDPAIFLLNRIKVPRDLSFLASVQYSTVHFGNDIALKSNN